MNRATNNYYDNQAPFTAAAKKAKKQKRKRKNKSKRETSPESSSSDSENSSTSEDSVEEGKSTKTHRLQVISKFKSHKWEFPGEMTDYVNNHFEYFIPEKYVEENLLTLRPVPENVRGVKKIGQFHKVLWDRARKF